MSARLSLAQPLPECALCETPTKRETFDRTGGLCSDCAQGIGIAAKSLPAVPKHRRGLFTSPGDSWVEVTD